MLTRQRIPKGASAEVEPPATIEVKVAHELQHMAHMRFVRLPFSAQHDRLAQLLQRDVHSLRVDQADFEVVAVTEMVPVKRHALDEHDRHDVQVFGVRPAGILVGFPARGVLPHRETDGVVERHCESLTQTYNSFGPQRVVRVHGERDEKVRVTQMDIRTNLLQAGRCPKDAYDRHMMR